MAGSELSRCWRRDVRAICARGGGRCDLDLRMRLAVPLSWCHTRLRMAGAAPRVTYGVEGGARGAIFDDPAAVRYVWVNDAAFDDAKASLLSPYVGICAVPIPEPCNQCGHQAVEMLWLGQSRPSGRGGRRRGGPLHC